MPSADAAQALLYRAMASLSLIALLYYLVRELRRLNRRYSRLARALLRRRVITPREIQSKEEDEAHEIFP